MAALVQVAASPYGRDNQAIKVAHQCHHLLDVALGLAFSFRPPGSLAISRLLRLALKPENVYSPPWHKLMHIPSILINS